MSLIKFKISQKGLGRIEFSKPTTLDREVCLFRGFDLGFVAVEVVSR